MTVVVIGAGAAGLTCASLLARHGCAVEVFEAADRLGGRVRSWSDGAGGPVWELGAQVLHPAGADLVLGSGRLRAEPAPRTEFAFLLDGALVPGWRAARLGLRPWELAGRLDAAIPGPRTVADWLARTVPSGPAAAVARAWFGQEWACPAEHLDRADTAAWVADRDRGDAIERVVPEGLSRWIDDLAEGLTVHRSTPVRRVGGAPGRPWVEVAGGRIEAEAVVVTAPPWTWAHPGRPGLEVTGADPAAIGAAAALTAGDAVAAVLTWSHPAPFSRTVFDVAGHGFLRSLAGARQLQLVSKGPAAATLRATLTDPAALTRLLRAGFGFTDGGAPADLVVADWGRDGWIRGGFSTPTPGHRMARRALRRLGSPGLFTAGEATRPDGTAARLPGAVRSGRDAAAAVLAFLSAIPGDPPEPPRPPARAARPSPLPVGGPR